jgi:ATP-dependent Clp protease ATP-binding subunit ClpB
MQQILNPSSQGLQMKPKVVKANPNNLSKKATELELDLMTRVIGQERAIHQLVLAYEIFMAGLQATRRPLANLLFLGPTGSGKTRLVEALAEALFGDAKAMVKIDCAEYQREHEVAKLIGSPPGYLGFDKPNNRLTKEKLEAHLQGNPFLPQISIVLFDEIEKAAPEFHQALLGILDKGVLTLGNSTTVDFSKTIVVMTSNLGSNNIAKLLSGSQLGFHNTGEHELEELDQLIYKTSMNAVRKLFSPEFVGRIDRTIVFRPLDEDALRKIVDLELEDVQDRIIESDRIILFDVSKRGKEYLLKAGIDDREGARNLKKVINREFTAKISSLIATNQLTSGDQLLVDKEDGEKELSFYIRKDAFEVPPPKKYIATPMRFDKDGNIIPS